MKVKSDCIPRRIKIVITQHRLTPPHACTYVLSKVSMKPSHLAGARNSGDGNLHNEPGVIKLFIPSTKGRLLPDRQRSNRSIDQDCMVRLLDKCKTLWDKPDMNCSNLNVQATE